MYDDHNRIVIVSTNKCDDQYLRNCEYAVWTGMSHISFLYKHCAMILITFAIDENYNNQQITVTYSASAQILSHRAVDSLL